VNGDEWVVRKQERVPRWNLGVTGAAGRQESRGRS